MPWVFHGVHKFLHDTPWIHQGVHGRSVRVSCRGHGNGMACQAIALVLQWSGELQHGITMGLCRFGVRSGGHFRVLDVQSTRVTPGGLLYFVTV